MKRIILTLLSAVITLIVSAQEKDTTIVIYYGYQAIDTVTISKSSEIYLQMQDAELVVKGITDDPTKHRASSLQKPKLMPISQRRPRLSPSAKRQQVSRWKILTAIC